MTAPITLTPREIRSLERLERAERWWWLLPATAAAFWVVVGVNVWLRVSRVLTLGKALGVMTSLGELIALAEAPPRPSYTGFEMLAITTSYQVACDLLLALVMSVFLFAIHRQQRFTSKLWRLIRPEAH